MANLWLFDVLFLFGIGIVFVETDQIFSRKRSKR